MRARVAMFVAGLGVLAASGSFSFAQDAGSPDSAAAFVRAEPFEVRPFHPFSNERWIGNGIAYGPHRDGQFPGGPSPSREELRQDLGILAKHWSLIRLYNAVGPAETILDLIREDGLDMKVMLGVWIDAEERRGEKGEILDRLPASREANRREVDSAVRLAAAYPDLVLCVNVGNETQVFWSSHRIPPELLIGYLREVRARTRIPVTTADDFNFWNKPESDAVAREIDCIDMHAHPLWNGCLVPDAVDWTKTRLAEIRSAHPDRLVILGEVGWATRRHTEGEEAKLMRGRVGEKEQKAFHDALTAWVEKDRIPTFFFEAFDENWKGGGHPDGAEKHWGLFRADRTPKLAMAGGK